MALSSPALMRASKASSSFGFDTCVPATRMNLYSWYVGFERLDVSFFVTDWNQSSMSGFPPRDYQDTNYVQTGQINSRGESEIAHTADLPCFCTAAASAATRCKSASTIMATSSSRVVRGCQPSFCLAFAADPINTSTSAGRSNFLSVTTYFL